MRQATTYFWFVFLCIKKYTPKKPLYLDLPVSSSKSLLSLGLDIGIFISTPFTSNNSSNLASVTDKFWFSNILFITEEVVISPLLMCSNAIDSGLNWKTEPLTVLKVLINGTV